MRAVIICQEFGWTWEEYQEQPTFFLDAIMEMFKAKKEAEKNTPQG